MPDGKITHPDGTYALLFIDTHQGAPGVLPGAADGPVDQVQVDRLHPQLFQALIVGSQG